MTSIHSVVQHLAGLDRWGYQSGSPSSTEAAAMAALALVGHGRTVEAERPIGWLMKIQTSRGSLGIDAAQSEPTWPTSLTALAWSALQRTALPRPELDAQLAAALAWMLEVKGGVMPRTPEMGHDSTLVGWPWVQGTHSWIEPTAMHLLALKALGYTQHARAREAVLLLTDRLLPGGGCNYGNTFVLGQQLLPHVQPTGACLLALAGEKSTDARVAASLAYLERAVAKGETTISLCYALWALAAHGRWPAGAKSLLDVAIRTTLWRDPSPYKLALLALAALGPKCPLVTLTRSQPVAV